MAQLQGLTRLRALNLNLTKVTDKGLVHLKGLRHLEELGLGLTAVGDSGMAHLKGLTRMQRMDLRATRLFQVGKHRISVYLDVFNALNRENAGGFEYSVFINNGQLSQTERYESLLPRIPTFGINWEF